MSGVKQSPIAYLDGVRIIAATPGGFRDVLYRVSLRDDTSGASLTLNQDDARELAAALTWIISEVDKSYGYETFRAQRRIAHLDANKGKE